MPLANRSLIIGGQPKAGTSSLFRWLSRHPDIAPSRVTEVRFFLDRSYPLPSGKRYNGANEEKYLTFFDNVSGERPLLDVSPDYLYCTNALNIPDVIPKARIVFIIRDPVERAVSWYKFSAQIGRLDKNMSFPDFINYQLENDVTADTPIHLRALEQNRVEKYLTSFKKRLGERCLVLDFADMKKDPKAFVQSIAAFGGIDPGFFKDVDFAPQNVSTGTRVPRSARLYYRSRAAFHYWIKPSPKTQALMRPLGLRVKAMLSKPKPLGVISVPPELATAIRTHAKT